MLRIMRRFEWSWAGLLFTDDSYGRDAAHICQSELARSGLGCLAYAAALPWDNDPAQTQRIVSVMKASTARVVVVIAYGIHMVKLMDEVRIAIHVHRGPQTFLVQVPLGRKNVSQVPLVLATPIFDTSQGPQN